MGMILPETKCTKCEAIINEATHTLGEDSQPVPGDLSICIECEHVMIYADDMTLRDMTEAEKKNTPWGFIHAAQFVLRMMKWDEQSRWN